MTTKYSESGELILNRDYAVIRKSDNKVIKRFPHYEQCVIWCYENKLVTSCGRRNVLNLGYEIK